MVTPDNAAGVREPATAAGRRLLADETMQYEMEWPDDQAAGASESLALAILAIEAEARQPDAAQIAALREALTGANQIIAMTRTHLHEDHPDCAYKALGILNDPARALLATTPEPPAPGLDVERLTLALERAEINCWANPVQHAIGDPDGRQHRLDAEAIARHYAALPPDESR